VADTANNLTLTVAETGERVDLRNPRAIIAGYTARDQHAVQAHIDELAEIGVEPPPQVPMFYEVDAALLTTDPVIEVDGARTSGEVEPVLVRAGGRTYLGVGSDHTDRELETRGVAESKAAAPKPLSELVLEIDPDGRWWDDVHAQCHVDDQLYQEGQLATLLTPRQLLDELADRGSPLTGDAVMFCGTFPLLTGEFVFGNSYRLKLRPPQGAPLTHTYDVKTRSH